LNSVGSTKVTQLRIKPPLTVNTCSECARTAPFQRAEAGIGGDAVQPGPQRRPLRIVPIGRPPGPQQRLLYQILGLLDGTEHPIAVRQQVTTERLKLLVPSTSTG
jgi:hypothetical protein